MDERPIGSSLTGMVEGGVSGSPRGRGRRSARRRNLIIGGVVGGLVGLGVLVTVLASVTSGNRSGTLVSVPTPDPTLLFSPQSGTTGSEIHLTGVNLANVAKISFGTIPATSFNVISATELTVIVPEGAVPAQISVTDVDETGVLGSSRFSSVSFTPTSPSVTSFSPTTAAAGETVTISGFNLSAVNSVSFNGKTAVPMSAASNSVTVKVPANATTGNLTVITPDTRSVSAVALTITSPAIISLQPMSASPFTFVTIRSVNPSSSTPVAVQFNGTPAWTPFGPPSAFGSLPCAPVANVGSVTRNNWPNAQTTCVFGPQGGIVAVAPLGFTTGPVSVRFSDGMVVTSDVQLAAQPVIASISPTSAKPGDTVTIVGSNFTQVPIVTFGTLPAEAVTVNATGTQITVIVPSDAVTGRVIVSADGQATSPILTVTNTPAPLVSGFWPDAGAAGTTVTISGSNLSPSLRVQFGLGALLTPSPCVAPCEALVVTTTSATTTGALTVWSDDSVTKTVVATSPGSFTASASTVNGLVRPSSPTWSGTATVGTTLPDSDRMTTSITLNGIIVSGLSGATRGCVYSGTGFAKFGSAASNGKVGVALSYTSPSVWSITPTASATMTGKIGPRSMALGTFAGAISSTTASGPGCTSSATSATIGLGPKTFTVSASAGSLGAFALNDLVQVAALSGPYGGSDPNGLDLWGTITAYSGTSMTINVVSVSGSGTFADWRISRVKTMTPNDEGGYDVVLAPGPTAATVNWTLRAKLQSSVNLAASDSVAIAAGADVYFTPNCPNIANLGLCAAGAAGSYLWFDSVGSGTPWASGSPTGAQGILSTVGAVQLSGSGMSYEAVLDLNSGGFNLDALYSVAEASAVSMRDAHLRVAFNDRSNFAKLGGALSIQSGAANDGFDIVGTGNALVNVPGLNNVNVSERLAYVNGGIVFAGLLGSSSTGSTAYTSHGVAVGTVGYVNGNGSSTAVNVVGNPYQMTDRTWVLTGTAALPSWVAGIFNAKQTYSTDSSAGSFSAYLTSSADGTIEVGVVVPKSLTLPPVPHLATRIDNFVAGYRMGAVAGNTLWLAANGTAQIDGSSPVDIHLELTGESSPVGMVVTASLTASGQGGKAVWPNILGVHDFNLNVFSVQLNITPEFPFLSVGLAGTGTLPHSLMQYIGATSSVPAQFVVNFSAVDPCLQVTLGTPDGTDTIAALPPGTDDAIKLTYLSINASPNGCTVGVFQVPAGIKIAANSRIFGTKLDLLLSFNPEPTGPTEATKTPTIYGWAKLKGGSSTTAIKANFDTYFAAGGWNPVPVLRLEGTLVVGSSANMRLTARCALICNASAHGAVDLLGVSAQMDISVVGIGSPLQAYNASGQVSVAGLTVKLTGNFTVFAGVAPLGFSFAGEVDFPGSALGDKRGVSFGIGVRYIPAWTDLECQNNTRQRWGVTVADPLPAGCHPARYETAPEGSFTASGNTGGLTKVINGQTDGRYSLTAAFQGLVPPTIGFSATSNFNLSFVTVNVDLGLSLCLQGDCAGKVTAQFNLGFTYEGNTYSINDLAPSSDWNFTATKTWTWTPGSGSWQKGDSWGGAKVSVSGSVTIALDVATSPAKLNLTMSGDFSASVSIGAGGKWSGVASFGVAFQSNPFRVCSDTKSYSGYSIPSVCL